MAGAQVTGSGTPTEAGFQLGPASPSGILAASGKSSGSILRAPEGREGRVTQVCSAIDTASWPAR